MSGLVAALRGAWADLHDVGVQPDLLTRSELLTANGYLMRRVAALEADNRQLRERLAALETASAT